MRKMKVRHDRGGGGRRRRRYKLTTNTGSVMEVQSKVDGVGHGGGGGLFTLHTNPAIEVCIEVGREG